MFVCLVFISFSTPLIDSSEEDGPHECGNGIDYRGGHTLVREEIFLYENVFFIDDQHSLIGHLLILYM